MSKALRRIKAIEQLTNDDLQDMGVKKPMSFRVFQAIEYYKELHDELPYEIYTTIGNAGSLVREENGVRAVDFLPKYRKIKGMPPYQNLFGPDKPYFVYSYTPDKTVKIPFNTYIDFSGKNEFALFFTNDMEYRKFKLR